MYNSKTIVTLFSIFSVKYCNAYAICSAFTNKMLVLRYKFCLFVYEKVKLALVEQLPICLSKGQEIGHMTHGES